MAKILIVDDTETLLLGLSMSLRHKKFDVVQATSITEAKQKFDESVDVLLTDFELGNESGFELITFAREKYPRVKIVLMSGATHDVNNVPLGRAARLAGAHIFLNKPFSIHVLLDCLEGLGIFPS